MSRPNKHLGQHFLTDNRIIEKIIDRSGYGGSDFVIEIGPGRGALTIPLAGAVKYVLAVEKDSVLVRELRGRLSRLKIDNVEILNADILRFDFKDLPVDFKDKTNIIGNLPYNISSPFIERLIMYRSVICRAVLMFQLEFANRLAASPGGREYGALSVLTSYYAEMTPSAGGVQ